MQEMHLVRVLVIELVILVFHHILRAQDVDTPRHVDVSRKRKFSHNKARKQQEV